MILHTGDMRWQPRLAEHPARRACKIELLYMDTTYCLPKHVFPSQVILASGTLTKMQAYTAAVFARQRLQSWIHHASHQTGTATWSCAAWEVFNMCASTFPHAQLVRLDRCYIGTTMLDTLTCVESPFKS